MIIMSKTNLQIRISPDVDEDIQKLSSKSKSDFVRRAIEEKIQREKDRLMQERWIRALKKKPDESAETNDWLKAEAWGEK